MNGKLRLFFISFFLFLAAAVGCAVVIDPFFHYHAPLSGLFYRLDNERSQNRGIARFFTYDAIITGTSLTEGLKTSEWDALMGTNTIKVPFSGATYYETGELERIAFDSGHSPRFILRSLDVNHLIEESDAVRTDLGDYPEYLYNDRWWDDAPYVCNIDVLADYCLPAIGRRISGHKGGHTSFDRYAWSVYQPTDFLQERGGKPFDRAARQNDFTQEDAQLLEENLERNILSIAREHPETTFIFFLPPYNVAWWGGLMEDGEFVRTCTAMRRALIALTACENIRVFAFADRTELTTHLELYQDEYHFINEVGSELLTWIAAGEGELAPQEVEDYCDRIEAYYEGFDYDRLMEAHDGD